jgi:hypothetical protein
MLKRVLITILGDCAPHPTRIGYLRSVAEYQSKESKQAKVVTLRDYFPFGKGGNLLPQLGGLILGSTTDDPPPPDEPLVSRRIFLDFVKSRTTQ